MTGTRISDREAGTTREPPRVLHLITRFLDGGAETTTCNTLDALREAPEEYDLRLGVGAEHDRDALDRVAATGVETVVFDSIRHYEPLSALVAVIAVARYLRREDVDVLHTHSTEAGVVGRIAGKLAGTPIVIHEIHGDPITPDRHPLLNAFVGAMERLTAPMATRLIVKSERIRETYLDRGIGRLDQYELVYHGVDLDRFRADQTPPETDGGPGAVELLFVGRLAEGKGLHDLLSAVDRLRGEHDVSLQIAGDGPLKDELETAIRERELTGVVDVLGYRNDVPELLERADVLVLPSYREGTPRAVTEALASGTPVVATNVAGLPEQVQHGDTGYLVEPGDVSALVDRLRSLVESSDLRHSMGQRASETVAKFDVDVVKSKYQDRYRDLIRERRSAHDQ